MKTKKELIKFINLNVHKTLNEIKNNKRSNSRILKEHNETFNNKNIINVDIQPEYENYITFNVNEWVNFINKNASSNNITFLYNGAYTLGMIDEESYKNWLFDLGINEDVIYNSKFYDKGYSFFRYCMDNSIDEENIIDLIKFMIKQDINDSREIDNEMWTQYMEETNHSQQDVRDLLENADDMINIPELMDFLESYSNIVIMGGGVNECLREVEIALLSLEKKYNIISKFTY